MEQMNAIPVLTPQMEVSLMKTGSLDKFIIDGVSQVTKKASLKSTDKSQSSIRFSFF